MDLIKLRYFVEVCRYNNMTKAAESLFVSQQNISKAISSLEDELGTKLFIRTGTSLRITSDGEYLLQKANWILAEENVIDSHFREKRRQGDVIAVGGTTGLLSKCSAAIQHLLLASHGNYNLSFIQGSSRRIEEGILKGELRFGMVYLPSIHADFDAIPLGTAPLCFVANRQHPLTHHETVSLYQLAQYPMILPGTQTVTGNQIDQLFRSKGLKPYNMIPGNNPVETILFLQNSTALIGCLFEKDLEQIKSRGITTLAPSVPLPEIRTALIHRRGGILSKQEREFQSALVRTFSTK